MRNLLHNLFRLLFVTTMCLVLACCWSPSSWKHSPIRRAPNYPDQIKLEEVMKKLKKYPPLIVSSEIRELQDQLAKASLGHGFVLMGGMTTESFKKFTLLDNLKILLQMALIMTYGGSKPIIKVGRIAGQFTISEASILENRSGVSLPSYHGDIFNGEEFTKESRTHNPDRMLQAYHQSLQSLNILRAFTMGGFADISRLHTWNLEFFNNLTSNSLYNQMCEKVDESLRFMKSVGVDTHSPTFSQCPFYNAHEALLLPYEEALTRKDSITGRYYDSSAHLVWIDEYSCQLDHAHVHFISGIDNPIGIKVSNASPDEIIKLLDLVNPENIAGRIVLMMHLTVDKLIEKLPTFIEAIQQHGRAVLWCLDPAIGSQSFEDSCNSVNSFFDIHSKMGTHPGGVHLELTTGASDATDILSKQHFTSDQALQLAFLIAERMRSYQGLKPMFNRSFLHNEKDIHDMTITELRIYCSTLMQLNSLLTYQNNQLQFSINNLLLLQSENDKNKITLIEHERRLNERDVRESDLNFINYFMDAMGLVRKFIIRIEARDNLKYSSIVKLDDKDILEALFVEPVDLFLDNENEIARKEFLFSIADDAHKLFRDLNLEEQTLVYLYQKVIERNRSTHLIDNKKHRDVSYMKNELKKLIEAIEKIEPNSEFASKKADLTIFFNQVTAAYIHTARKL